MLLNFQNLSFLICKMGLIMIPHRLAVKVKKGDACKATSPIVSIQQVMASISPIPTKFSCSPFAPPREEGMKGTLLVVGEQMKHVF